MLAEASVLLLYAKGTTQAVNGLRAHCCVSDLSFHSLVFLWAPC